MEKETGFTQGLTNPKRFVQELSDAVNSGNLDTIANEILDQVEQEHPTLQQAMMGVLWRVLWGYEPGRQDPRNESAARLSADLREQVNDGELPAEFPLR